MNLLSLEEIGTELDVFKNGKAVCTILVIDYHDFIEGTTGPYDDRFETFGEYSTEISIRIKEHVVTPLDITWYALPEDEQIDLNEVASRTVKEGNKIVIIEYLD